MKPLRVCFALAVCLLSGAAHAETLAPELDLVQPAHFTRGKATLVRVSGRNFGGRVKLLVPFPAEVREASSSDTVATFSITPKAEVPLGRYPLRIIGPGGLSNLRLIAVSDLPVVAEQEPNDRFEQAQKLDVPCVVTGPLDHPARDIETFRIQVAAGSRLTIMTQTRALGLSPDLRLSLFDAKHRLLATAEGTPGLLEDERIDHTFAEAGEYFVRVHDADYENIGWTNDYTLVIGDLNYVRSSFPLGVRRGEQTNITIRDRDGRPSTILTAASDTPSGETRLLPLEKYPGSLPLPLSVGIHPEFLEDQLTAVEANAAERADDERRVAWPATINGRIAKPDEQDSFRLMVKPGQKLRVVVEACFRGSQLDGQLLVYDPAGKKLIAENNDTHSRGDVDPGLWFEAPAGVTEVVVALRDVFGRGGDEFPYRLTIEPGGPDFQIVLGKESFKAENDRVRLYDRADTLNLRPGVAARLPISISRGQEQSHYHFGPRHGFKGPITVRAVDVPAGIRVEAIIVPAGATTGELVITADDNASREPLEFTIIGEATRDDGSKIRHVAERRFYLCEPAMSNMKWNYVARKVTAIVLKPEAGSHGGVQ